ncbi:MAG: hypothetical protein Q4B50_05485, partial [Bacillota bacterium]|nr:hypothetical protein [Bacillota bacterium]
MKYLVMECHSSYAILLDEEGRFLKAANLHYNVGQRVESPVLMREAEKSSTGNSKALIRILSGLAACLLLFFGFRFYQSHLIIHSSIFLSINPAVQIDLNQQESVLRLQGSNADGCQLLEGYRGWGKDKVTVVDELIDRAIELGFLSEGGCVSFSIDAPDQLSFQKYGTELRTEVSSYLSDRMQVQIEIYEYHKEEQAEEKQPQNAAPPSSAPAVSPYSDSDYSPAEIKPSQQQEAAPEKDPGLSYDPASDYGESSYDPTSDYGDSRYSPVPASGSGSQSQLNPQPEQKPITNTNTAPPPVASGLQQGATQEKDSSYYNSSSPESPSSGETPSPDRGETAGNDAPGSND